MGKSASYVSNLVEVHKELLRAYHGLSVDNVSSNDIMESRSSGSKGIVVRGKGYIFCTTGITLSKREYAKAASTISTNYYNKNKEHEGVCFQYCTYDDKDFYYLYYDYGFDNYKFVGGVDGDNSDFINLVKEGILDEKINRGSKDINFSISGERSSGRGDSNSSIDYANRGTATNDDELSGEQFHGKTGEDNGRNDADSGSNSDGNSGINEPLFSISSPVEQTKNLVEVHKELLRAYNGLRRQ